MHAFQIVASSTTRNCKFNSGGNTRWQHTCRTDEELYDANVLAGNEARPGRPRDATSVRHLQASVAHRHAVLSRVRTALQVVLFDKNHLTSPEPATILFQDHGVSELLQFVSAMPEPFL